MIVVLRQDATEEQIALIEENLTSKGLETRSISGAERSVVAVIGKELPDPREIGLLPGVAEVIRVSKPYKLASREAGSETSRIPLGRGVVIGGSQVVVMAGPCSVEGREKFLEVAGQIFATGATMLRGGAFKPRSSPYSFQGMGEEGLKIMAEARERFDMPIVTEVMSPAQVELVAQYADVLQVGTRNMQNFELLKEIGAYDKPVLLKRGLAATIEELLMSAEYILAGPGNAQVILCERGIRTYESSTRNTLDLSAIPVLRTLTHLPIVADPSHGTGNRNYVPAMALAAVAAGADGLMIECHQDPPNAFSDGAQSLYPEQLRKLVRDIAVIAPVVGKQLEGRHRSYERGTTTGVVSGRPRVVIQGVKGSFSSKAVRQYFGDEVDLVSVETFQDLFERLSGNECDYGMVPVENSLTGSIHVNYDLMLEHPELTIVGEAKVRVVHNLVANPGVEFEDIEQIFSHPQAAAQCDAFLRANQEWQVVNMYDTAGSAAHLKEKGYVRAAAIASVEAAEDMGLAVLKEGIETHPRNFTRFVILTPEGEPDAEADKVSIVFDTKHEPGALHAALECFSRNQVNMMKLESRPIPGKPWEYMFYVDLSMPDEPERLDRALDELKKRSPFFRLLGRYRKA